MANELTMSGSISLEDSEFAEESIEVQNVIKSMTTKKYIKFKMQVGTSEEALPLGEVTTPGYAFFINRDQTNFVNLRVGTAGAIFARLDADTNGDGKGGFALLKLGSGAQAPYAIADTAACQIEGFICST